MLATADMIDTELIDTELIHGRGSLASSDALTAPDGFAHLLERLLGGARVRSERIDLVDAAAAVWSRPGFDTLMSGPTLTFQPFDYQLQTVSTVLGRMRGRAILADEVGPRQDHRGRAGAVRAADARVGPPGPGGHPGRTGRSMARGIGTQVRPPHHRPAARRMGHHGRVARRGRLAGDRPAGSDQVCAGGGAVGPDRRGRGASTAKPPVGVGPVRPRTHLPLPAVVDRDAGGEQAVRPLRTDQPGRTGVARHAGGVPPELWHGHGDADAAAAPGTTPCRFRGDDSAPSERGRVAAPSSAGRDDAGRPFTAGGRALRRHRRPHPAGGDRRRRPPTG